MQFCCNVLFLYRGCSYETYKQQKISTYVHSLQFLHRKKINFDCTYGLPSLQRHSSIVNEVVQSGLNYGLQTKWRVRHVHTKQLKQMICPFINPIHEQVWCHYTWIDLSFDSQSVVLIGFVKLWGHCSRLYHSESYHSEPVIPIMDYVSMLRGESCRSISI